MGEVRTHVISKLKVWSLTNLATNPYLRAVLLLATYSKTQSNQRWNFSTSRIHNWKYFAVATPQVLIGAYTNTRPRSRRIVFTLPYAQSGSNKKSDSTFLCFIPHLVYILYYNFLKKSKFNLEKIVKYKRRLWEDWTREFSYLSAETLSELVCGATPHPSFDVV